MGRLQRATAWRLGWLLATATMPSSCRDGGDGSTDPGSGALTVTLAVPDSLVVGQTAVATLERRARGDTLPRDVRWAVSDTARAFVVAAEAAGTATLLGKAPGTVTVTATLADGRTATHAVRVVTGPLAPIVDVQISGPDSLEVGQQALFFVEARDAAGYYYYRGFNLRGYLDQTATISDSSVLGATAPRPDEFSVLEARRPGTVTLTVTANGITASRTIRVTPLLANAPPTPVAGGLAWRAVGTGDAFSCGLTTGGAVYCWGLNDLGQLGVANAPVASLTPVRIPLPVSAAQLSVGPDAACAAATDGAAYCWGSNEFSKLGTLSADAVGAIGIRRLAITTPAATVSVGSRHSCAATRAGDVYCLGLAEQGQLGAPPAFETCYREAPYYCRSAPAQVETPIHFASLAADSTFTCALTADGAAYCWGNTAIGGASPLPEVCAFVARTGGGPNAVRSTPCTRTPLAVTGGHRFTALDAGELGACGVRTDGAVLCWSALSAPAPVPGVRGATAVSVGTTHACAVAEGGAVLCWGANGFGQLGVPQVATSATPLPVPAPGSPAVTVSAGGSHSCSVTADARAVCWGNPRNGRLGQGAP